MKTLRKVARIRRFRSLVLDMPTTGADGEATVRITIKPSEPREPSEPRHRARDEDMSQRTVWALRAQYGKHAWMHSTPQHAADEDEEARDREAAPEEVAA